MATTRDEFGRPVGGLDSAPALGVRPLWQVYSEAAGGGAPQGGLDAYASRPAAPLLPLVPQADPAPAASGAGTDGMTARERYLSTLPPDLQERYRAPATRQPTPAATAAGLMGSADAAPVQSPAPAPEQPSPEQLRRRQPGESIAQYGERLRAQDMGDFHAGWETGVKSLKQLGAGAAAALGEAASGTTVGDALGANTLRDWGVKTYQDLEQEMQPFQVGRTTQLEQIEGPGSAIDWAQYQLGNVAPSILESVGAGLIGSLAGSAVPGAGNVATGMAGLVSKGWVKRFLSEQVAAQMAKGAVKDVAETAAKRALAAQVGAGAALFGSSYIQGVGDVYGETLDAQGHGSALTAFLTGLPYAALDTVTDLSIFNKVLRGSDGEKALGRYAKAMLMGGVKEGGAESGQEALLILAGAANGKTYDSREVLSRLGNSFAAGALAGGVMGVGGGHEGPSDAAREQATLGNLAAVGLAGRTEVGGMPIANLATVLTDPAAPVGLRADAVAQVEQSLREHTPDLADLWIERAGAALQAGAPIPVPTTLDDTRQGGGNPDDVSVRAGTGAAAPGAGPVPAATGATPAPDAGATAGPAGQQPAGPADTRPAGTPRPGGGGPAAGLDQQERIAGAAAPAPDEVAWAAAPLSAERIPGRGGEWAREIYRSQNGAWALERAVNPDGEIARERVVLFRPYAQQRLAELDADYQDLRSSVARWNSDPATRDKPWPQEWQDHFGLLQSEIKRWRDLESAAPPAAEPAAPKVTQAVANNYLRALQSGKGGAGLLASPELAHLREHAGEIAGVGDVKRLLRGFYEQQDQTLGAEPGAAAGAVGATAAAGAAPDLLAGVGVQPEGGPQGAAPAAGAGLAVAQPAGDATVRGGTAHPAVAPVEAPLAPQGLGLSREAMEAEYKALVAKHNRRTPADMARMRELNAEWARLKDQGPAAEAPRPELGLRFVRNPTQVGRVLDEGQAGGQDILVQESATGKLSTTGHLIMDSQGGAPDMATYGDFLAGASKRFTEKTHLWRGHVVEMYANPGVPWYTTGHNTPYKKGESAKVQIRNEAGDTKMVARRVLRAWAGPIPQAWLDAAREHWSDEAMRKLEGKQDGHPISGAAPGAGQKGQPQESKAPVQGATGDTQQAGPAAGLPAGASPGGRRQVTMPAGPGGGVRAPAGVRAPDHAQPAEVAERPAPPARQVVIDGVPLVLEDEHGTAKALRGKAASASGFHSYYRQDLDLEAKAREHVAKAQALPYLVGPADNADAHWQDVSESPVDPGRWEIRIPTWAAPSVQAALAALGFDQSSPSDKINGRWGIRAKDANAVRDLMRPLLAKGTRLADEDALAAQLRAPLAAPQPKGEKAPQETGGAQVIPFPYMAGMSRPRDFEAALRTGGGVGVVIGELSGPMRERVVQTVQEGKPVFVDSGAFSVYTRAAREGRDLKSLSLDDWTAVFDPIMAAYSALSQEVRKTRKGRLHAPFLMLVMPDVVGDQMMTRRLLSHYRDQIQALDADNHEVIVPMQVGDLSAPMFHAWVTSNVFDGSATFIPGIPSAKEAMSDAELEALITVAKEPHRLHILGAASPGNPRFQARLEVIRRAYKDDVPGVTADAMRLRAVLDQIQGLQGEEKTAAMAKALSEAVPEQWRQSAETPPLTTGPIKGEQWERTWVTDGKPHGHRVVVVSVHGGQITYRRTEYMNRKGEWRQDGEAPTKTEPVERFTKSEWERRATTAQAPAVPEPTLPAAPPKSLRERIREGIAVVQKNNILLPLVPDLGDDIQIEEQADGTLVLRLAGGNLASTATLVPTKPGGDRYSVTFGYRNEKSTDNLSLARAVLWAQAKLRQDAAEDARQKAQNARGERLMGERAYHDFLAEHGEGIEKMSDAQMMDHYDRLLDAYEREHGDPVTAAANAAATSPENALPEPTEAQKEAGNYQKGHLTLDGLEISIENPAGSRRRPEWPALTHHYGYFLGSLGRDKDHVDVFLGPDAEHPKAYYVVDQIDPQTGRFDEHKVMMGFASEEAAREGYQANYTPDWQGLGAITTLTPEAFKAWIKDPEQTKRPLGGAASSPDKGALSGVVRPVRPAPKANPHLRMRKYDNKFVRQELKKFHPASVEDPATLRYRPATKAEILAVESEPGRVLGLLHAVANHTSVPMADLERLLEGYWWALERQGFKYLGETVETAGNRYRVYQPPNGGRISFPIPGADERRTYAMELRHPLRMPAGARLDDFPGTHMTAQEHAAWQTGGKPAAAAAESGAPEVAPAGEEPNRERLAALFQARLVEGYPDRYEPDAKPGNSAYAFADAILARNAAALGKRGLNVVDPGNKASRKAFTDATGIKLPRTISGAEEAIRLWAQEEPKEPPAPMTAIAAESGVASEGAPWADIERALADRKVVSRKEGHQYLVRRRSEDQQWEPEETLPDGRTQGLGAFQTLDEAIARVRTYVQQAPLRVGDVLEAWMSPAPGQAPVASTAEEFADLLRKGGSVRVATGVPGQYQTYTLYQEGDVHGYSLSSKATATTNLVVDRKARKGPPWTREEAIAFAANAANLPESGPAANNANNANNAAADGVVGATSLKAFEDAIEAGKRAHYDYDGQYGRTLWVEEVPGRGWVLKEHEDGAGTTTTKGGAGYNEWSRAQAIGQAVAAATNRFTQWTPLVERINASIAEGNQGAAPEVRQPPLGKDIRAREITAGLIEFTLEGVKERVQADRSAPRGTWQAVHSGGSAQSAPNLTLGQAAGWAENFLRNRQRAQQDLAAGEVHPTSHEVHPTSPSPATDKDAMLDDALDEAFGKIEEPQAGAPEVGQEGGKGGGNTRPALPAWRPAMFDLLLKEVDNRNLFAGRVTPNSTTAPSDHVYDLLQSPAERADEDNQEKIRDWATDAVLAVYDGVWNLDMTDAQEQQLEAARSAVQEEIDAPDFVERFAADLHRFLAERYGQQAMNFKALRKARATEKRAGQQKQRAQRGAGQAAASAAQNTAAAFQDAMDGLTALFNPGGGTFTSGVVFNEDTYAKAKPHFVAMAAHLRDAGQDIKEVIRAIVQALKGNGLTREGVENMRPYILAFANDVESGEVKLGEGATLTIEGQQNDDTGVRGDGKAPLEGVAPEPVGGAPGERPDRGGRAGSGASGAEGEASPDAGGLPGARGGRGGAGAVHPPATGTGSGEPGPGAGSQGAGVPGHDAGAGGDRPAIRPDGRVTVPAADAPAAVPAVDFEITDEVDLGKGSEGVKFQDNLAAIRVIKALEAERRRATPEEQRTLARYVGWGGLANAFADNKGRFKPDWEKRGSELAGLLTPKELAAARASTRNAHYTSQIVTTAMWSMARRLGFRGGLVLELSAGIGNFLGLMPKAVRGDARTVAVELDSISSRILRALYPQATVLNAGAQTVPLPVNQFDLAIGNPPFGEEGLRWQYLPHLNPFSIHNQFMLANLEALKPGGIQVMVSSRYLMDGKDTMARAQMARQAKFLGAVRLPDTAFKENARTEVVTDILVLQKRTEQEIEDYDQALRELDKAPPQKTTPEQRLEFYARRERLQAELPWVETTTVRDPLGGEPIEVNAYYKAHPEMMLGSLERSGKMAHREDVTLKPRPGADLRILLAEAITRLPAGVMAQPEDAIEAAKERFKTMSDALELAVSGAEPGGLSVGPNGEIIQVLERETPAGDWELTRRPLTAEAPWSPSLLIDAKGRWFQMVQKLGEDGKPVKEGRRNVYERRTYETEAEVPDTLRLGQTKLARLKGMVGLRDLLREQLVLEVQNAPEDQLEANRTKLRKAYEAYRQRYGLLNDPANAQLVGEMPDEGLILSLEHDYKTGLSEKRAKNLGESPRPATATPAPILFKRVQFPYQAATQADSPEDALALSLAERGKVDLERIAELLGVTPEAAEASLTTEAEEIRIFRDPETERWETRDTYLSGNVRRKLAAAEAAGLGGNAEALRAVQPETWTADKIQPRIGSAWVPPEVYAEFLEHLAGLRAVVRFTPEANAFGVNVTGVVDAAKARDWTVRGQRDSIEGDGILFAMLNSMGIKVGHRDDDGKYILDEEATTLANVKADEMAAEFESWVYQDVDRRQRLVDLFNDKFNVRVTRQWDGSHMQYPGKVPDEIIRMRRHQNNAVWRGIVDRAVLYDHVVGAGKTFTAIARAMERRRLGLSRKPMIVVPNHLIEAWAQDVQRLYPGAKVLAAGKRDFEKRRRRRLFAKIATGDYDIVLVPHSSFGFLNIAPETETRYLLEELRVAEAAVEAAWEQAHADGLDGGWRKPYNVKEAERLLAKIEARLDRLRNASKRDRLLTFEQLGVDDLTIDEAHEFKNLYYSSRLTKVRGMGNKQGSQKAFDLHNKVRVLMESPSSSVVFMTGTPISNSAVEMYTIMRYLLPQELRDFGLEHFDAWRAQYSNVSARWAFNPSGTLEQENRLGPTWNNMRSLMDLYYSVADVVTLDDIRAAYAEDNNGAAFPVPKIKGGGRRQIVTQPTPAQVEVLEDVVAGFQGLEDIEDPKERNAERLRLYDQARKVALDVRAVNPPGALGIQSPRSLGLEGPRAELYELALRKNTVLGLSGAAQSAVENIKAMPEAEVLDLLQQYAAMEDAPGWAGRVAALGNEEGGKLDVSAKEIARIYHEWHADRGTQLVFLDRSIPHNKADAPRLKEYDKWRAEADAAFLAEDEEALRKANEHLEQFDPGEMEAIRAAQAGGWNAYEQLKRNLVDLGIPAHEIRFVQEANSDIQKKALFDAVNLGEVRVLIGSSPRMGAGTNVQERLVALHHLDVDWKPSTIEQREGRIVRQGNHLRDKYGEEFAVEILAYVTERTIDAKMWDMNGEKLRNVNGIRKYDGQFDMEFDDEEAVSFAETAALASGNPLLMERVKLGAEIKKLELLERANRRKIMGLEDTAKAMERTIEQYPAYIAQANARRDLLTPEVKREAERWKRPSITIEGQTYTNSAAASEAAVAAIEFQKAGDSKARFTLTVDGEELHNVEKVRLAIRERLGHASGPFVATIDGQDYMTPVAAGAVLAEKAHALSAAMVVGQERRERVGTLLGMDLSMTVQRVATDEPEATESGSYITSLAIRSPKGETLDAQEVGQYLDLRRRAHSDWPELERMHNNLAAYGTHQGRWHWEERLEADKRDLPAIQEQLAKAEFPQAKELKAKRARLEEVVRELSGAAAPVAAINQALEAEAQQRATADMDWEGGGQAFRFQLGKVPRLKRGLDRLVEDARSAADYRDWYQRHEPLLRELFEEDAGLFRDILAATSQGVTVASNVALALKAYRQMVLGLPFEGVGLAAPNLEKLRQGVGLGGLKIGTMAQAVAGDAEAVVVDRHVSRHLFGVDQPTRSMHRKAKEVITQAAKRLGWTPRETQAALWAQRKLMTGEKFVDDYEQRIAAKAEAIRALRRDLEGVVRPGPRGEGNGPGQGQGADQPGARGGTQAQFRLILARAGAVGNGLRADFLQTKVDTFAAAWKGLAGIGLRVVQSEAELPRAIRRDLEQVRKVDPSAVPKGVWAEYRDGGKEILFVADNIQDVRDALVTLLHEGVGHAGVRGMLGDRLDTVLDQVVEDRSADVARMAQRYGLNMELAEHRRMAAEELLAHMAEQGDPADRPLLERVYQAIRQAIRAILEPLGLRLRLTEGDLREILAAARRFVQHGGDPNGTQGGTPAGKAGRFMFSGWNAETANRDATLSASDRLRAGEDPETVRRETGWFRGPDGRWRFEISDANAALAPNYAEFKGIPASLSDVLVHPALFAAYPQLAETGTFIEIDPDYHREGGYDTRRHIITVKAPSEDAALSILLHEIQHNIQKIEGFAGGGNPAMFNEPLGQAKARIDVLNGELTRLARELDAARGDHTLSSDAKKAKIARLEDAYVGVMGEKMRVWEEATANPYTQYRRLAGEVEARNTQRRRDMGRVERRAIAPAWTQDVAPADVTVLWNGRQMASAPPPANGPTTRFSLADEQEHLADMQAQAAYLDEVARARGYAGLQELAERDTDAFVSAAAEWRMGHALGTVGTVGTTRFALASDLDAGGSPLGGGRRLWDSIQEVLGKTGVWAGDKWRQALPVTLGALTLRQLAEVGNKILPGIRSYGAEVQRMDTRRNQMVEESGVFASDQWEPWARKRENRQAAEALASLMHDSTRAQVDPSDYQVLKVAVQLGPGQLFMRTREATLENVQELRRRARQLVRSAAREDRGLAPYYQMAARDLMRAVRAQQKRDEAYPELRRRWDALPAEAQAIYREARDLYKKRSDDMLAALLNRVEESQALDETSKRALAAKIRQEFENPLDEKGNPRIGPYFPLARFGRYYAFLRKFPEGRMRTFRKLDGEPFASEAAARGAIGKRADLRGVEAKPVELPDGSGWVLEELGEPGFWMFESPSERRTALTELERDGWTLVRQGMSQEASRELEGISEGFMAQAVERLRGVGSNDEADMLYQMYLQTLHQMSIRKHFLHRKGTTGYSNDALRAFGWNMMRLAHQVAKLEHVPRLERLLLQIDKNRKTAAADDPQRDSTEADNYLQELRKRHEWVVSPDNASWTNFVNGLGFTWYLGVTPGAALVNLSQTPIVALPMLAAKFKQAGWGGASKALGRAFLDVSRGFSPRIVKGFLVGRPAPSEAANLTPEERQAFAAWDLSGVRDRTRAHNLAGIGDSDTFWNGPHFNRVMAITSSLFHAAEVVNRDTTLLAGYRLARAQGMTPAAAARAAEEVTWDSHFDYANANRSRWMQSNAAKSLLMFRSYSQHMTWLMWRNLYLWTKGQSAEVRREARTKFLGVMGMTGLFAGSLGLPIGGLFAMANLAAAAFGDDDEPWDAEIEFRNWLARTFPSTVADILDRGAANTLTGLDWSSRVSLRELWYRSPDRDLDGSGTYQHIVEQFLGPLGGIASGPFTAMDLMAEGYWGRAAEAVAPKFLKDALRAGRYASEGVLTKKGVPVVEDVNAYQEIWKALGMNPDAIRVRQDANSAVKLYEGRIEERRSRLMTGYALALIHQDSAAQETLLEKIRAFNQAQTGMPITARSVRTSVRNRERAAEQAAEQHGMVVNRKLAPALEGVGSFGE